MPFRHVLSTMLAILTMSTLSTHALAFERAQTLTGDRLSIDSPCARHVDIQPDAALHAEIVVHATADHSEELAQLLFDTQDGARIHAGSARCWRPDSSGSFTPTLTLTIRVPSRTPLSIDEAGAAEYAVGAVGGALRLDLSGSVTLVDAQVAALDAQISGFGRVAVARAQGEAHVDLSGAGSLAIDDADLPVLSASVSGAGHVTVAHGQVGRTTLDISGAGGIRIDAVVDSATAEVSGLGKIRLARVTGTLRKDISGIGTVTVGD
ncbi:MAG: GIN domain-containing protein [Janthinobacterium lividum]